MHPTTSRLATLMGTASLVTLSSILAAQGQQVAQTQTAQAAEELPEQVLITGSLIHGTAAVGVPVTNLSPQDFAQTGALTTAGSTKLQGLDWNISYDWDMGDLGAFNAGVTGTYYLHRYEVNFVGDPFDPEAATAQDQFHTNLGDVGGVAQNGVESLPRMSYRARLGWSNGPWSLTGFMNYTSHFCHTQNAPPNVNFQCTTTGGTIGGGTSPCLLNNYTNLEPSWYTFDLSAGYDTGDDPANNYLKHIGIQLVVQNLMDSQPAFEYRVSSNGGNAAAFDVLKGLQGRTISLIVTKTW